MSVVIITLNEERNIGRCIDSVAGVASEVVVVDSLSTDATSSIAREKGARVVEQPFLGHIEQKNFAITQARHDLILSLDADEALSDRLRDSILDVLRNPQCDGYRMNRLTNYCGQWIRHGGWYPDTKLRLFRKGQGEWTGTNPHDRYEVRPGSRVCKLEGDLLHYSFYDVAQHDAQIEKFTDIAAKAKWDQGIKAKGWMLWLKPLAKFVRNYVLKAGFLDGYYGWVIARKSAHATYLRYKKLRQIQIRNA